MSRKAVVETHELEKQLRVGEVTVYALRGISLEVRRGEFVAVVGPSGSGKSTLLGLIGGLDLPSGGTIAIDGVDITRLGERQLTRIRNEKIGFVFQSFNLIPTLTALENVALPLQFDRRRRYPPARRAREVLEVLGLGDRLHHRPSQLSGGQQQRVAIARALANDPPLLLADEPTGNLDSEASQVVMGALRNVQREMAATVILVTHDESVAARADRIIALIDGHLAADDSPPATRPAIQIPAVTPVLGEGDDPRD